MFYMVFIDWSLSAKSKVVLGYRKGTTYYRTINEPTRNIRRRLNARFCINEAERRAMYHV